MPGWSYYNRGSSNILKGEQPIRCPRCSLNLLNCSTRSSLEPFSILCIYGRTHCFLRIQGNTLYLSSFSFQPRDFSISIQTKIIRILSKCVFSTLLRVELVA